MSKCLRLILGDQLNREHSWFEETDQDVMYCMMEVQSETSYVKHHFLKISGFFAAMRDFANWLEEKNHQIIYYRFDDKENHHSFSENIKKIIDEKGVDRFEYQLPDEYRLDQIFNDLQSELKEKDIAVESVSTEHFYTERGELQEFFEGKKELLMERFYRHMRKKHQVLINDDEKPEGGDWNYDQENRKKLPKNQSVPQPYNLENDISDLSKLIEDSKITFLGKASNKLNYPINPEQTERLLNYFCDELLPFFGKYQDALSEKSWSLFHSRLSFAMNLKIIKPKTIVDRIIEHGKSNGVDIAQIEGFVRQILGWREFMRGVYWMHMPKYAQLNHFNFKEKLPEFFWTGETKMACVSHAVKQSLDEAYAHHIQRLMITGNIALLLNCDPDEVDSWYLGIYADAIEWVEITNTRGMSQYADGGIVGTKPYVSSANYINKMSHYCKACHYDHKEKTGERSCPFNSLYWKFYSDNEDEFSSNPRTAMMMRIWNRYDESTQKEILKRGDYLLKNRDKL